MKRVLVVGLIIVAVLLTGCEEAEGMIPWCSWESLEYLIKEVGMDGWKVVFEWDGLECL